jgi:hypothetical protein
LQGSLLTLHPPRNAGGNAYRATRSPISQAPFRHQRAFSGQALNLDALMGTGRVVRRKRQ